MKMENFLEPKRIISYPEGRLTTKREYDILKKRAHSERTRIKAEYYLEVFDENMKNDMIASIITFTRYNDLTTRTKEIMLANAVLPDDIKILDVLAKKGYTIEHIKKIMSIRLVLKNLLSDNSRIPEELQEDVNIYQDAIRMLINIFKENFHVNDSTIILNKLCILLVIYPELFEEKNNSHRLKR